MDTNYAVQLYVELSQVKDRHPPIEEALIGLAGYIKQEVKKAIEQITPDEDEIPF